MPEQKLVRGLGRWDITAITINSIIGAGIFGLPSKVAALIGTYSLFGFLLCALIIGLIVLCFAEVSSRFSTTGGMFVYAREAFGPAVGFEIGWLTWIVRLVTFAANCNLMIAYLGFFIPGSGQGWVRIAIILFVIMGFTIVNLVGVRESAIATTIFTIGKLAPLLIFVAVGAFFVSPQNITLEEIPSYTSFSGAILLLIYAFVGFENAVVPAGETQDPQRTVPFAILIGAFTVATLYILVQIVCIGTLPGIAQSEKPLADAALNFLGAWGAAFITIGAIVSILGNLNAGFFIGSRLPFAMAEQNELPRQLAQTHRRFLTPHFSIAVTAVVITILTIQSSFLTALTISTITRLLIYATTCLALPVFRRRKDLAPAAFRAPFGITAAALSLLLIAWLLSNVDYAKEGLAVIIAASIGFVLFLANRIYNRKIESDIVT